MKVKDKDNFKIDKFHSIQWENLLGKMEKINQ